MERRCVITGMGAVTPVGNDVDTTWENIKNGVNGIGYITKFDTEEFKVKIAGEVKHFNAELYVDKKDLKRNDMFSIIAIAAAQQAFDMAGLVKEEIKEEEAERFGCIVGSGIGGFLTLENQISRVLEKGPGKISPLFIPMAILNMAAGNISLKFGAKGVCEAVVTACASGTNNIGEAFRYIKHGYADMCFAGGSECAITKTGVAGFTNLTALSTENDPNTACKPFDKNRNGFVMGEGAGVLVLESLEHAKKRGAHIYAEIAGYGCSSDAYHITSPAEDGSGAARAMTNAMQEAGVLPQEVDYINAHGTGTHHNDLFETRAIKLAFGEAAENVPVSSTKSMVGHLLGAAGAVELIACIKSVTDGYLHPNVGLTETEDEMDLQYIKGKGIETEVKTVLSNSLGFGGHNATLLVKKFS